MKGRGIRTAAALALITFLALTVAGCGPVAGGGQPEAPEGSALPLSAATRIGQTFATRHAGLSAVEVHLFPIAAGDGEITLVLRDGPRANSALTAASLLLSSVTAPGFYRFVFPSPIGAAGDSLYAELTVRGEGVVGVSVAPGQTYPDGAAYRDGEAQDLQTAFRLAYAPGPAILGLAREATSWLGLVLAACFLFLLPGWALLAYLWPGWETSPWPARAGLSAGLSLAVYPILLLWTEREGLHLGAGCAWAPPLLAAAYLIWRNRSWRPAAARETFRQYLAAGAAWPDLAFLALAGTTVLVRAYAIRGLDVPLWGDSVQHTFIVQLLLDHGGLFTSWQPYADMQGLTYHFGFHAAAASLAWVTGLDAPHATLWMGQIANVLAVLALYPLAWRIGGSRWAGVAAVLAAGLLSPLPMGYTNWGRYTQLAGQVTLPAVAFLAWERWEGRAAGWRPLLAIGLAVGGLSLIHYRVLIMAVAFLVCLLAASLIVSRRRRTGITDFIAVGFIGGLIFLPWFLHLYGGRILARFGTQMTTPPEQLIDFGRENNAIGDLTTYLPAFLWVAFVAALAWGLWRRSKGVAILAVWMGLLVAMANPAPLGLPGTGAVNNFAVYIAAYLPAAVLAGAAAGWMIELPAVRGVPWQGPVLAALMLGAGFWGAPSRLGDMTVETNALVTKPDVRAAAWIRANTPPASRFLVNSFPAYGGSVVVGSDAGWWLPLLARRANTLPPILYADESAPTSPARQSVNALTTAILSKGPVHADVLAMLRDRGVTHVYLGQLRGRVNYAGPVIEPAALLADAHFRPVYHEDQVWVFEVFP